MPNGMASSTHPEIPHVLYCGILTHTSAQEVEARDRLLRSESVEAALARLITATGTLQTVNHDEHLTNRQFYTIQVECTWPKGKAVATLDPRGGTISHRHDGYDVIVKTRTPGHYSFIILNPYEVVYRVVYHPPSPSSSSSSSSSSSPIIIASKSSMLTSRYRRRPQSDPREPQQEVDSLVSKLNRPPNPLDDFSVVKIATSHDQDVAWAKDELIAIVKRLWVGTSRDDGCWRCVLVQGESPIEMRLRVLFLSFGRKPPSLASGLRAVHEEEKEKNEEVEICLRPSHLRLTSSVDPSTLQRTAESLSTLLGQMGLGETREKKKK